MRHAFVRALTEAAQIDKQIFLITGDLGFRILEPFAVKFPDRFLNIGVAEANMVSVAAGLSTTGYKPYIYSIATFATMRAYEQIRDDICLQNLDVKVIGIGGGLAYTKAGPTHHSLEDIALMRILPNMSVVVPQDPNQAYLATKAITKKTGPLYLRLERNPIEPIKSNNTSFVIGKGFGIQKGKTVALLATGAQVYKALDVSKFLEKKKIIPSIYSFPTVKPLDKILLKSIAKNHDYIVTLEEHMNLGGFGSFISETFAELQILKPVLHCGLPNEFAKISADYETLVQEYNFTAKDIAQKIIRLLKKN